MKYDNYERCFELSKKKWDFPTWRPKFHTQESYPEGYPINKRVEDMVALVKQHPTLVEGVKTPLAFFFENETCFDMSAVRKWEECNDDIVMGLYRATFDGELHHNKKFSIQDKIEWVTKWATIFQEELDSGTKPGDLTYVFNTYMIDVFQHEIVPESEMDFYMSFMRLGTYNNINYGNKHRPVKMI
jgi:hypothetical protein